MHNVYILLQGQGVMCICPSVRHDPVACQKTFTYHQNFFTNYYSDLIEHGLTSAATQYRLYGRRFLRVWWPNQQCQSTEGGRLVIQTGLTLTRLTSPCYNNTTCMQILYKKITAILGAESEITEFNIIGKGFSVSISVLQWYHCICIHNCLKTKMIRCLESTRLKHKAVAKNWLSCTNVAVQFILKLNTDCLLLEQQWNMSKGDITLSNVYFWLFWMFVAVSSFHWVIKNEWQGSDNGHKWQQPKDSPHKQAANLLT